MIVYTLARQKIYLNGKLIKSSLDRNRNMELRTSTIPLNKEAMELLNVGKNTIAIEADYSQVPSRLFDIGIYRID